jgi:hypothetical protein
MAGIQALREAAHVFPGLGLVIAHVKRLEFGGELNHCAI